MGIRLRLVSFQAQVRALSVSFRGTTDLGAGWLKGMRFAPEQCCNRQRIDSLALPPSALVAPPMELTMVQPTDGHGELVAGLAAQGLLLSEFDMMGIRRGPAADETGLSGYEPQMIAIALAHGFGDHSDLIGAALAAL